MADLTVKINADEAIKQLISLGAHFNENRLKLVLSRTINKSLLQVRTAARKEVKDVFAIPQKYAADYIDINKSNRVNLNGQLVAKSSPLPLDAFNPSFRTRTKSIRIAKKGKQNVRTFNKARKKDGNGVTVQVYKGQKEIVPYAFMIEGKGKVFARGKYKSGNSYGFVQRHKREQSKGNDLPISALLSISVYGTVVNPTVMSRLNAMIPGLLLRIGKHEIEYEINKKLNK